MFCSEDRCGTVQVGLLKLASLLNPQFKAKYNEKCSLKEIKFKVISEVSTEFSPTYGN